MAAAAATQSTTSVGLSFNDLPDEILCRIFSNLPLPTLLLSVAPVNSRWRNIVQDPRFMPWKKFYHIYKLNKYGIKKELLFNTNCPFQEEVFEDLEGLKNSLFTSEHVNQDQRLVSTGDIRKRYKAILDLDNALPWALQYLTKHFDPRDLGVFSRIRGHSKYNMASEAVKERFPEFMTSESAPKDVAVIFVICCIAEDAWDVREIISALLRPCFDHNPKESATGYEVTELLYATALIFLFLSRNVDLPIRLHFNVYQAIYYFETDWSYDASRKEVPDSPSKGQASLLSFGFKSQKKQFTPTAEQQRIINHPLEKGSKDVVKIIAFAGTGKTTTLIRLCKRHPELKFLVVMYNKSTREMAESSFPAANVTCKTVHSMAYGQVGKWYRAKLAFNLKPKDIIESKLMSKHSDEDDYDEGPSQSKRRKKVKTPVDPVTNHSATAAQIQKTIESYMNSADQEITSENVPSVWMNYKERQEVAIPPEQRSRVLGDAKVIWNAMKDLKNKTVRMPHDGYLKLWQLRNPDLQDVASHDVLLVDEGQDLNPTMYDMFLKQKTPKFVVGDPHQQIYTFRGAINALGLVNQTHTYYLTQSFRFGPEVAFAANCSLTTMKSKDQRTLVGGKKTDKLVPQSEMVPSVKYRPIAVIGRTNLGLMNDVIDKLCDSDQNYTGDFNGGIKNYNLDTYLDVFYLMVGQKHRMKKFKGFSSFEQFEAFAQNTGDNELISKVNLVKQYPNTLPTKIEKIKEKCRKRKDKQPDFIFTTAHKAKGLEWDNVYLLDDFFVDLAKAINHGLADRVATDEINLLYVAITRAKKNLAVSYPVRIHLANSLFHMDRVIPGVTVADDANCGSCSKPVISKKALHYAHKKDGVVCSLCGGIFLRRIPIKDTGAMYASGSSMAILDRNRTFLRYLLGPLPSERQLFSDHMNEMLFSDDPIEAIVFNFPGQGVGDEEFLQIVGHEVYGDDEDLILNDLYEPFGEH